MGTAAAMRGLSGSCSRPAVSSWACSDPEDEIAVSCGYSPITGLICSNILVSTSWRVARLFLLISYQIRPRARRNFGLAHQRFRADNAVADHSESPPKCAIARLDPDRLAGVVARVISEQLI